MRRFWNQRFVWLFDERFPFDHRAHDEKSERAVDHGSQKHLALETVSPEIWTIRPFGTEYLDHAQNKSTQNPEKQSQYSQDAVATREVFPDHHSADAQHECNEYLVPEFHKNLDC